jgi:HEAT repeat protein
MLASGKYSNLAAITLAAIGTNSLPVLLDALTNGSKSARLEAAGVMGIFREAGMGIVPALVERLQDEASGVRLNAIASLQSIPESPDIAVPALIRCLSDPDLSVRKNAMTVLEKYAEVEANATVPILLRAAEHDENPLIRFRAAEILHAVQPKPVDGGGT